MSGSEVRVLTFEDLNSHKNNRGIIKLDNKGKSAEKLIFEVAARDLKNARMKVAGNIELRVTGEADFTKIKATQGATIFADDSHANLAVARKNSSIELSDYDIAKFHATKGTIKEDGIKLTTKTEGSNYDKTCKAIDIGGAVVTTTAIVAGGASIAGGIKTAFYAENIATLAGSGTALLAQGPVKKGIKNNVTCKVTKPHTQEEPKVEKKEPCDCPEPEVVIKEVVKEVKVPCPEEKVAEPEDNKKPEEKSPEKQHKPSDYIVQNGESIKEIITKVLEAKEIEATKENIEKEMAAFEKDNKGKIYKTKSGYKYLMVGSEVKLSAEVDTSKNKAPEETKKDYVKLMTELATNKANVYKTNKKTQDYKVKSFDSYWKISSNFVNANPDTTQFENRQIHENMYLIRALNDDTKLVADKNILVPKK